MLARDRLERYRADVDSAAAQAAEFVSACISAFREEYPESTVAEIRDYTIEAIRDSLSIFGDQAAEIANGLFEDAAADQGVDAAAKMFDGAVSDDAVVDKARYLARKLAVGDWEGYARDVRDVSAYYVKRSAFENMVRNCSASDLRYARVTTGLESCAFCFMLSSRGFVYHTEATALGMHGYHRNCDCIAVPGFGDLDEDAQVEGYAPSGMRERFRLCAETVDVDGARALDPEYRKRVLAEVERRDWRWLYDGKSSKVDKESGAHPLDKEKKVGSILSNHGFAVHFLKEINTTRVKTADAVVGHDVFEFKIPERWNGEHTVRKQFYKARGKNTDKLLISCTENKADLEDMCKWVLTTFQKGDYEYINEVIVVSCDGNTLRRLAR